MSVSLSVNFNTKAIYGILDYDVFTVDNDVHWKYDVETGWGNEGEEGIVVSNANAVVDPGTVVVVTFNTHIANGAMARAWGTNYLTVRT